MAQAVWSGTISFGLVNVPVKMVVGVREKRVRFHLLSEDGSCRLRRKLYCPDTGEELDFRDTARGFEIAPGQYVLVQQEEIDEIKPEKGNRIDIEDFVQLSEIDPIFYDRPYYLKPDKGGSKAYRLLLEAMQRTGKAAVGRFVMRERQYLAVMRPKDRALLLSTIHYADEVVDVDEVEGLPEEVDLSKRELEMAEQLIDQMSHSFEPTAYRDEYRERLEQLIETKAAGGDISAIAPEEEGEQAQVIDLMDALKKSLGEEKKSARGSGGNEKKAAGGGKGSRKMKPPKSAKPSGSQRGKKRKSGGASS